MKPQISILLAITGIVILVLITFDKTSTPSEREIATNQEKHVSIVTTSFPLYEFAKTVGGDMTEVILLLPPGVEPHSYDPKPSDIVTISNADLFIYNGAGMEPWAYDILEGIDNEKLSIMEASTLVDLLNQDDGHDYEHVNENFDPHIWLDFVNDQLLVNAIASELAVIDPENSSQYLINAERYMEQLNALDTSYLESLSNCKYYTFITGGHNAYSYLANRYDLAFYSVYELSPDSEPTPRQVKEIIDITQEHGIRYIMVERLVNPRMAETIASEVGAETLIFNPGGNLSKEEFDQGLTFIALMEQNLSSLTTALECQ